MDIVCPYHAWTYDLDGGLTAVPHRKEFDEFSPDHYGKATWNVLQPPGWARRHEMRLSGG